MMDGKSGGYPTLFLLDWLHLIERRDQVSRELDTWSLLQNNLHFWWTRTWQIIGICKGLFLVFATVSIAIVTIIQRQKALRNLKGCIARDLHDEVGSSLGSISLTAERLESDIADADTKQELSDLSLLAREASASLRDVVWMVDQASIRLPVLLEKLVSRAERVLRGVELTVELPPSCPDQVVPLNLKRHLVMFFKEVIHNCARHSGATNVSIKIGTDSDQFVLSVEDNGCGLDPEEVGDGWGVDSLKKRALELGGEMTLMTERGNGTVILLSVPMKAIFTNTDHQYKTSNE